MSSRPLRCWNATPRFVETPSHCEPIRRAPSGRHGDGDRRDRCDRGTRSPSLRRRRVLRRAVERCLEIIGEAAKSVSPAVTEAHPEIPWSDLAKVRDRLSHHYHRVDHGISGRSPPWTWHRRRSTFVASHLSCDRSAWGGCRSVDSTVRPRTSLDRCRWLSPPRAEMTHSTATTDWPDHSHIVMRSTPRSDRP